MQICLLGRGKTGSLVAEVARQRHHQVRIVAAADNQQGCGLTAECLKDVDVVMDFTTPHAVIDNIKACVSAGKNMVVGTTGWDSDIPAIRKLVEKNHCGF